jgi:uncharacterized protein (DUF58 family)
VAKASEEIYQFPRRLTITRQGKIFLGITVAVGIAALNTGNNLLFLCLGLLLSIITVSGILSELDLRSLELRLLQDHLAFVGRDHTIEIEIRNPDSRRTVFAITLSASFTVERDEALLRRRSRRVSKKNPPHPSSCTIAGATASIAPGEVARITAHVTFRQRGEHALYETLLETEYPFGLFRKGRLFFLSDTVAVAPAPEGAPRDPGAQASMHGEAVLPRPGHSVDVFDVREAQPGDDIRQIAWLKSATRGELVTIRRAADATDVLLIALPEGRSGEAAFERSVAQTAGLVHARLRRGAPTALLTAEGQSAPAVGHAHERALMLMLARTIGGPVLAPPRAYTVRP